MKKSFALAAVTAACSAVVSAQDKVLVYGTVDLGVWHQTKAVGTPPNTDTGGRTVLHTGGLAPSVFGLRGEETIGHDLKATFNLEAHLDPSTGQTGLNALWARGANVGLAGSWGEVKLGQQIVPALIAYLAVDPGGIRESLSGIQPWALSSLQNLGTGTATPNSTLAFFASNAISYQQTKGGLYLGALYAFGEMPGNSLANRVMSAGASFTGPVIVGASFHASRWASTGENSDRKASLGLGVPTGPATWKLNYLSAKTYASTGVMEGDWQIISAGGDYRPNDRNTLIAAYYRGRNRMAGSAEDKADSIVLSHQYSFSKRTIVYEQLAAIKAGNAAGLVVSILGAQPAPGTKSYVVNLGIRHTF
jgi:predicted porin